MLRVRNLMVFFENALALNDFSMELPEGELRGIIGSNSAGKTTLMHALSGLLVEIQRREQLREGERITVLGRSCIWGKISRTLDLPKGLEKELCCVGRGIPSFRKAM